MNAFINYAVEANLGLCLFMLLYWIVLRKETDFTLKRTFLLVSIFVSLIFPGFHFNTADSIVPTLSAVVPSSWLPEVIVYGDGAPALKETHVNFDSWILVDTIYTIGVLITLFAFLFQLVVLARMIYRAPSLKRGKLTIIESSRDSSAFSFFRFIFIGTSDLLSDAEKDLIIDHERVHAERLHSFDVLVVNLLGIFFWFNPVIRLYKKIFIHLHEYEADARAVRYHDVNEYCSLLAKVALLSADIRLANHFSNSLTVKRIEMMRTLKAKIRWWKIAAVAAALPLFFFVVACHDQVITDITAIARNSSHALLVPEHIQARYDQLKKDNPGSSYILVELNETAEKLLAEMEQKHGVPKSIELYTPDQELVKLGSNLNTGPEKISVHNLDNQGYKDAMVAKADGVVIDGLPGKSDDAQTFAIIEYNDMVAAIAENAKSQDEVYSVTEEAAEFPGGLPKLVEFLQKNVHYPDSARMMGLEGTVFVSFIVNKDGSVSDAVIVKGKGKLLDGESLRVVNSFPKWVPAKNGGQIVRASFVLPVKFALN